MKKPHCCPIDFLYCDHGDGETCARDKTKEYPIGCKRKEPDIALPDSESEAGKGPRKRASAPHPRPCRVPTRQGGTGDFL